MLNILIGASVDYLLNKHVIEEDDRDVYEYGFHALYNNIIDISSIIIISIFFNQVLQTILYHISYIILRNTAGGYHAKTHIRCFIMSTVIWLLSLWAISHTSFAIISIGLAGVDVFLIWAKAPVEHINNPLSAQKLKRMKVYSRVMSTVILAVILFISTIMKNEHLWIATSLAYGMASHTILMLVALSQAYLCKTKW